MKTLIVLGALIAVCVAMPQMNPMAGGPSAPGPAVIRKPPVPIVKMGFDSDNQGQFNLEFQSGDGTSQREQGSLKDLGDKEGPVQVTSGSYSYVGTDGRTYTVNWTADERGFLAQGEHLPTPPPIPAEILRSLQGSA